MTWHDFIWCIKHAWQVYVALDRKYEWRGYWYKWNRNLKGKIQILKFYDVKSKYLQTLGVQFAIWPNNYSKPPWLESGLISFMPASCLISNLWLQEFYIYLKKNEKKKKLFLMIPSFIPLFILCCCLLLTNQLWINKRGVRTIGRTRKAYLFG